MYADTRSVNLQPHKAMHNDFSRKEYFSFIANNVQKLKGKAVIIANNVIFFAIICILDKSVVYSLVAKLSANRALTAP